MYDICRCGNDISGYCPGPHNCLENNEFVERLKAFERRLEARMGEIQCPTHLCLGQEEAPAALHKSLRPDDWLFSTHRGHGHYLAKGGSEQKLWDEIFGLATGVNGGFSGSQCFSDPSINFHASAIVGGLVGVAVGTALALKLSGSNAISVCCIGDAVSEQGVFWESVNFAAVKKLPIAFICENNGYSIHVPIEERQSGHIPSKVRCFGIAEAGNVYIAVGLARQGNPSFVEIICKRECAHVGEMPDLR